MRDFMSNNPNAFRPDLHNRLSKRPAVWTPYNLLHGCGIVYWLMQLWIKACWEAEVEALQEAYLVSSVCVAVQPAR